MLFRSEAVRLVSTAAETYFKDRAEMMRRLEVLQNTLGQNTKFILPSNADIVTVLGLDSGAGSPSVLPLKTGGKGAAPSTNPGDPLRRP